MDSFQRTELPLKHTENERHLASGEDVLLYSILFSASAQVAIAAFIHTLVLL